MTIDYKVTAFKGSVMTVAILTTTVVVKKIKKDMAPPLTFNSLFSLGVVTILSKFVIDYAKNKGNIPKTISS